MPSQQVTRDEIRKAQDLVCRIQDISSCQISTDAAGKITEVHVVATSDKAPKLIARDVETCLKAEMGLDVDHRTIGVVLFNSAEGPQSQAMPDSSKRAHAETPVLTGAGEPVVEFPVEEFPSRFAFQSVNLHLSENTVRAEVELSRESDTAFGSAQTDTPNSSPLQLIAEATLRAVSEYLDEKTRLCLRRVQRVTLEDESALVVLVDLVTGRDRKGLVGASVVSENENQTAVFATLDAVNRVLGKLNLKSSVEYKIR
jgi:hypothetical protein